jgi:large subunit ribosomal protein L1
MAKHGKKYREAANQVEQAKVYPPREAIELAKKTAFTKFDETLELHLRMGLDPRHAEQQVRGIASLPHGLGKKVRILAFTQGEAVRIAEEAGADYAGGDDLIKKVEEGWLDFDVAIATPDIMGRIGKLGKILGRRGLMPNPKVGTVVAAADLPKAIKEVQAGRVEFKMDRTANIHLSLGKVSFEADKLLENLTSVIETVVKSRPSGAKGQYVKSAFLTTSMGPSIELDLKSTLALSTA